MDHILHTDVIIPGPGSGHYEFIVSVGRFLAHLQAFLTDFVESQSGYSPDIGPRPATGHYMTIHSVVITPSSRKSTLPLGTDIRFANLLRSVGSIKLASSNPFTFPLINPNFFSAQLDRDIMLEAVKGVRRFAAAAPWKDFVTGRFGVMGGAETDDEIIAAARNSVVTIWHPTSSARMSPKGAKFGVVDPDLLVKGISGLRIVDASVIVSPLYLKSRPPSLT